MNHHVWGFAGCPRKRAGLPSRDPYLNSKIYPLLTILAKLVVGKGLMYNTLELTQLFTKKVIGLRRSSLIRGLPGYILKDMLVMIKSVTSSSDKE